MRTVCVTEHCFVWMTDGRTAMNWWTGDGHCKLLSQCEVTDSETATLRKVCLTAHCFVWMADDGMTMNW